MESVSEARPRKATLSVVAVGALALMLSACGSGSNYANNPRPPMPIVVTAAITKQRVEVSPTSIGGGLIKLVVTNLTGSSQQLTLKGNQSGGYSAPISQQTGPINPQDTGSLSANVTQGSYSVQVQQASIKAGTVQVGAERNSSQNQVLLP